MSSVAIARACILVSALANCFGCGHCTGCSRCERSVGKANVETMTMSAQVSCCLIVQYCCHYQCQYSSSMITASRSHSLFRIIALILFGVIWNDLKLKFVSANCSHWWLKNVCAIVQTSSSHLTGLRNFRWSSCTYWCLLLKKCRLNLILFGRSLMLKAWGFIYLMLIFLTLGSENWIFKIRGLCFGFLLSCSLKSTFSQDNRLLNLVLTGFLF